MKKYKITFVKKQIYEVEAENPYEAEDIALDFLQNDKLAFSHEHIDEIEMEEVQ